MYVQPKTSFIYIPKYSDTSSWEEALESAERTISKLDKALDETARARDLAGAARDHCAAIADLKEGVINSLATEYSIPEKEIIERKRKVFLDLPDDTKKDINPEVIEKLFAD